MKLDGEIKLAGFKIPYDFHLPTPEKIKSKLWNTEDENILQPHVFGIGWSVNLAAVCKKLGITK